MLELLKTMLTGQNAFASGGLMLMVIGGLSVYLRAVPERLWYWIVNQTTMMITVNDDDAAFVVDADVAQRVPERAPALHAVRHALGPPT